MDAETGKAMSAIPRTLEARRAGERKPLRDEKRDSQRRPFIATIQLFDLRSGETMLCGRTSDLSAGGCYVDCMNVVPADSQYRIRIQHAGRSLEAVGAAAYATGVNGFGLSFVYMSPQDLQMLNEWLCELRGEAPPWPMPSPPESAAQPPQTRMQFQRDERTILTDLVSMLVKRGVLPAGDGNRLLRDLAAFCDPER